MDDDGSARQEFPTCVSVWIIFKVDPIEKRRRGSAAAAKKE